MQAEIIAIGTELLLGAIVDTNSAYLSRQLATIGVSLRRITVVHDDLQEMIAVIRDAMERAELVICSGGLGPTPDDLTRDAIAAVVEQPLEFHQILLDDIAARFAAYKRTMSPSNRQQAYVPRGTSIIRNPVGTAPAFVAERDGRLVAALPGVPSELMYLTEHALLPYLRDEQGQHDVIVVREVRVAGLPESVAGERIAEMMNLPNPVVGITAKQGQHTIRIAATASSRDEAEAMIAPLVAAIGERFRGHLLGEERLEERVGRLLLEREVGLVLREAAVEAPVFRFLASSPQGRSALALASVTVRPWQPHEGDLGQAALAAAAQTALRTSPPTGSRLALVVVPEPDQSGAEPRPVHLLLTDGSRQQYLARGFDLQVAHGYDFVASAALEMLRRWLEGDAAFTP